MAGPVAPEEIEADVAIVGSGLAGSILARVLVDRGRRVVLVERGSHPRFALGESSTPLAALSLERLASQARSPGLLDDLAHLSAAGLWRRHLPHLGRGTKRGFTFHLHRPGESWRDAGDGSNRLLVAASPSEELSDNHWLREDVDAHLVERAVAAGVRYLDRTEIDRVELPSSEGIDEPVVLTGRRTSDGGHAPVLIRAAFVVDATGPAGFLAGLLGLPKRLAPSGSTAEAGLSGDFAATSGTPVEASGTTDGTLGDRSPNRLAPPGAGLESELPKRLTPPETVLLYGHFADPLPAAASAPGLLRPGPYPDRQAAVHHLLATGEGWAYELPFDHPGPGRGPRVSFGVVLRREVAAGLARLEPGEALDRVLAPYPSLTERFGTEGASRPLSPVRRVDSLAFRVERTHGRRWLVLPHGAAFFDPLFSTGIAWSLLGVERAADLLISRKEVVPSTERLEEYSSLLTREADHLERLVAAAWRAMGEGFRSFVALSHVYFAAASFSETVQRLRPRQEDRMSPWELFLGAGDELIRAALDGVVARLAAGAGAEVIERFVAGAIGPRNVAGLADPARGNLYPADLEVAAARAHLVGATPEEVRMALAAAWAPAESAGRGLRALG